MRHIVLVNAMVVAIGLLFVLCTAESNQRCTKLSREGTMDCFMYLFPSNDPSIAFLMDTPIEEGNIEQVYKHGIALAKTDVDTLSLCSLQENKKYRRISDLSS